MEKFQAPNHKQISSTKFQISNEDGNQESFEIWSLGFGVCLEFMIWDLSLRILGGEEKRKREML